MTYLLLIKSASVYQTAELKKKAKLFMTWHIHSCASDFLISSVQNIKSKQWAETMRLLYLLNQTTFKFKYFYDLLELKL